MRIILKEKNIMKTILITFLSFLAISATSFQSNAQSNVCCPYINTIEVLPANPTTNDNVKIAIFVATPGNGEQLSSSFSIVQNDITAEACYFSGLLTVITSIYDTLDLGMLTAGTYTLDFTAFLSTNDVDCDYSDTTEATIQFEVTEATNSLVENGIDDIKIYPNPSNGEFTLSADNDEFISSISIVTTDGKIIESLPYSSSMRVSLPAGTYFVHFYDDASFLGAKKVVIL